MHRLVPFVIAAALAAACSPDSPSSSSASSNALVGNTLGGDAALGITVPDAYTALSLSPIARGAFPFFGSDGKYHVAYDLLILNVSAFPTTLEKLEIVDAAEPTKVLASFSGANLVDPNCAYGDSQPPAPGVQPAGRGQLDPRPREPPVLRRLRLRLARHGAQGRASPRLRDG